VAVRVASGGQQKVRQVSCRGHPAVGFGTVDRDLELWLCDTLLGGTRVAHTGLWGCLCGREQGLDAHPFSGLSCGLFSVRSKPISCLPMPGFLSGLCDSFEFTFLPLS
jgi:hypothetical protein